MDKVVWRFVLAIICFVVFLYLGLDRAWFNKDTAFTLGVVIGAPTLTGLFTYLDLRNEYIAL